MSARVLRIAVLGAGTVGREVVRALVDASERFTPADGAALRLVGVAVRDVGRAAANGVPGPLLVDAPAHLVASPDTDVVVELIGGEEPARTLLLAALSAGKAVVTANKQVLARYGPELEAAARRTGAALRFEAAVGGGIPVLAPLARDLAANSLTSVRGIVNGTTNHILSEMAEGRGTYDEVLRSAQRMGYAEADPSADVEGRDAISKLVVLARLAFGEWRDPAAVRDRPPAVRGQGRPGITGVTGDELAAARRLGFAIRLVALATPGSASVVPTALPAGSALGATGGVRNRIEVRGEPIGMVGFDGPGAGGPATSSAVVADLVALARGEGSTWAGLSPAGVSEEPPSQAPIETRCGWLAWLPGVAPVDVAPFAEATAASDDGVAIRTGPVAIEELRSRLGPVIPAGLDPQLYPIDD